MLLRRFTEHVQAQNWFAVGIDLLVVIFGVYAGMQVAAWNEERQDRIEEIEYLERILQDLDESIAGQQNSDEFQQTSVGYSDWVMTIIDAGQIPEGQEQEFGRRLYQSGRTNPLRYRLSTVEEMIAAGKLGLIQNTKVRSAVGRLTSLGPEQQTLANKPDRQSSIAMSVIYRHVAQRGEYGSYRYEYDPADVLTNAELRNAILTSRNMTSAVARFSRFFTNSLIETRAEIAAELKRLTGA